MTDANDLIFHVLNDSFLTHEPCIPEQIKLFYFGVHIYFRYILILNKTDKTQ